PARRAREYALSPQLAAVSHVWERGPGEDWLVATKGAPEAVAELCRLPLAERAALAARVRALGEQGLRVRGVARGHLPAGALPASQAELPLHFIGLVAFADPLRADVAAAVAECRQAGLRVVMITGDGAATAQSIAREAGLPRPGALLDGEALARLGDAELAQRIDAIDVFARVVPAQKLRIVEALKARGEIVAMTGDGVNDAPALKAAHIGIAMGGRGSDVAREAGALVLLDDDFGSIVRAVRLGRRIYDNIRKAVAFIIAVHVPIAGLSMLPVLFPDWPLLLLPAHILSLELIIDPACSLVFEAERAEPDVMQRPPRRAAARLFSWPMVLRALLQGLSMLAACVAVFMLARADHGTDAARALTFAALVTAILATILTNRSRARGAVAMLREPNAALWWVLGGTTAFLVAVLVAAPLQRLFHFAPLTSDDLALALLAGIACLAWLEAVRWLPVSRRAGDRSR
ncbi:MAG: cation-translocating P-type ATPase, partial [Nannocystaceae bacterium]